MSRAETTTLAEMIRQKLADDILRGVYPPGARLDEIGLAKRFKLSRTPVREALRQLTSAGLVEMRPRRGVIVSLASAVAAGNETITPRRGRISTSPAEVNCRSASRTGVRDSLKRLANPISSSRAPGG